jgi:hypothetical protein
MTNIETSVAQMLNNREAVLGKRDPPRVLVVDLPRGY